MVGIDSVAQSYYTTSGAAYDSLVTVLIISGTVTLMAFVLGVVLASKGTDSEQGFLGRKPLLLPSVAFVITVILVISLYPIPMAQYHGMNEVQRHTYDTGSTNVRVYDSTAYQRTIEIYVSCFLDPDESLTVQVDFKLNGTIIESASLEINGTSLSETVTGETAVQLQPGLYEAVISHSAPYRVIILSQPLVSGFFDEVLDWETYMFMLTAGSVFFILIGLCVANEDKKRFSQEKIDQEPPRDGRDYYRKY